MAHILIIDSDEIVLATHARILRDGGYDVIAASTVGALERLVPETIGAIIASFRLRDAQGQIGLAGIRRWSPDAPLIVSIADAMSAADVGVLLHLGASDCIGERVPKAVLLERVAHVLAVRGAADGAASADGEPQPHAAARWARAIVAIVDCPHDPRTIDGWGRWIAASSGAIRNWCATAALGARRSLVFGRILRVVILSQGGRRKPENLLDVVDRRTLNGLLRLAGLDGGQRFPRDVDEFLERQILIRDRVALLEVRVALRARVARTAVNV